MLCDWMIGGNGVVIDSDKQSNIVLDIKLRQSTEFIGLINESLEWNETSIAATPAAFGYLAYVVVIVL